MSSNIFKTMPNCLPWSFVKEIPSSKSSSQLSVCSSGCCNATYEGGWIFSAKLMPDRFSAMTTAAGLTPGRTLPAFQADTADAGCRWLPTADNTEEVAWRISPGCVCRVGELGRAFRVGCFEGFDGAIHKNMRYTQREIELPYILEPHSTPAPSKLPHRNYSLNDVFGPRWWK